MPRYEDLTGQRFGRLTVLEATNEKTKDGRRIWKCQCDCGNIKFTSCQNLKRGHCTSCGCKNKEQIVALGHSNGLNLIGQVFNKLTVIEKAKYKLPYSDSIAWICKCECGNTVITTTSALRSKNTTSCGKCSKSAGEENLIKFFNQKEINFYREYEFPNLLSNKGYPLKYDFYLPEQNILIEFDGEQHYILNRYSSKEQFLRDCKKNKFALDSGIPLYRIPYSEKINILNYTCLEDMLQNKFKVLKINHYDINYY